jgi:hypothetical protein
MRKKFEKPAITDIMCPSVSRDLLFVLLLFTRPTIMKPVREAKAQSRAMLCIIYKGKKLFTHIRAAEHCNHS